MKIKLLFVALFLCMGIMGCEEEEKVEYEIYENHIISACGIKDPLKNIKCLKEHNGNMNIFLLKDTVTGEEYFEFIWNHNGETHNMQGENVRMNCSCNTLSRSSYEQNKNIILIDTIYLKKYKK